MSHPSFHEKPREKNGRGAAECFENSEHDYQSTLGQGRTPLGQAEAAARSTPSQPNPGRITSVVVVVVVVVVVIVAGVVDDVTVGTLSVCVRLFHQ